MADISTTFTNFSNVAFNLAANGSHLGDGKYEQKPSSVLVANSGQQVQSANFPGNSIIQDKADMWCCWQDPTSLWLIGVKIHVPAEVGHAGTSPYYYYVIEQNPQSPNDEGSLTWIKESGASSTSVIPCGSFTVQFSGDQSGQDEQVTVQINPVTGGGQ